MDKVIIVRVSQDFQPEEGTAFDAVVAALDHFNIPAQITEVDAKQVQA
jgi:hypothetical protein